MYPPLFSLNNQVDVPSTWSEPQICHDLILQIISYQIKDYTRDHESIGLFLGNSVFGGEFGYECFSLFLFCFRLVRGEKVASAQDFGWQSKGEDHFKSWFPFFPYLLVVTTLYCSDIVWSKDLLVYFFCFLLIFDWKFFFPFAFFWSLIGNFLLFLSFGLWSGTFFSFLSLLLRARMSILTLGQGLWWVGILARGL